MSSVLTEQSERGAPIKILHIQVGTTLDSVQEEDSGEHMLVASVHNEDLSSKNKVMIQEVGGATGSEPSDLPPDLDGSKAWLGLTHIQAL